MKKLILQSILGLALILPAFAADPTPIAGHDKDNTGINKRDADHKTMTPEDQSNSEADIKITTDIRRAIVKDDNLSAAAKNIKIITAEGVVALRGPVKSESEKAAIEKIATSAAPKAKIVNEIEIEKD